ncbi:hypothetical protein MP228_010813 [Amoeboaphelidium protococcarum]|nr:hypothetical protein MP228_010813 [Amoeboaphelidium protococcarum]
MVRKSQMSMIIVGLVSAFLVFNLMYFGYQKRQQQQQQYQYSDEEVQQDGKQSVKNSTQTDNNGRKIKDLTLKLKDSQQQIVDCKQNLERALAKLEQFEGHDQQQSDDPQHDTDHQHGDGVGGGGNLVMFTIVKGADEMVKLRELVGSLHELRSSNLDTHLINVYAFNLPQKNINEMSLWRNVQYFDGEDTLLNGHRGMIRSGSQQQQQKLKDSDINSRLPELVISALDLQSRIHGNVLYIGVDVQLTRDIVHSVAETIQTSGYYIKQYDDLPIEDVIKQKAALFGAKFGHKSSSILVQMELQCIRGYHCDEQFYTQLKSAQIKLIDAQATQKLSDLGLTVFQGEKKHFCYLLLRDDILYSSSFRKQGASPGEQQSGTVKDYQLKAFPLTDSGKVPIAIGMPTLSVSTLVDFKEVAPIRVFMPSFLKSVTVEEWKLFEYWVYIGYDEGDKYFDDEGIRGQIDDHLLSMVADYAKDKSLTIGEDVSIKFNFIRFPYSKGWVTYIWNGLFVSAINDGAHYYYQVNDDLELVSAEWSIKFTNALKKMDGFGVAGPWDTLHNGNLLTQAFVSRVHYYIFGKFYPLDIKDWHSDNWITDVYDAKQKFVIQDVKANNKNDKGTRYDVCASVPKYKQLLQNGKNIIKDWLDDQALLKKTDPQSNDESEDRLQRELSHGTLIQ